jgi:formylmethanofuran dehydrogenase subunit E
MGDFEILLKKAEKFHGHLCPGIVLGTRMSMAGMRELGLNPMEKTRDLIVYVEIDRCATDAIQAVTGCSLGHRSLKYMDYGKFAATFVNSSTGKAVRVSVIEKRDENQANDDMKTTVKRLSAIPESEILSINLVTLKVGEKDRSGFPTKRVNCSVCGEQVMDGRELYRNGKPVCKACANGAYYT